MNYTSCALRGDQGVGSLHGQWNSLPVPVVFDKDFYVADGGGVIPSLKGALETWSHWANLRGFWGAYRLLNDNTGISGGRDIPELTDCSQASYSSAVTDAVGVWKINGTSRWHENRRSSCGTNTDGSPGRILPVGVQGQTDWIIQNGKIIGASILLNFEGYNAPGQQRIDVESLLLHELGHVLGLLHSCNGSGNGGTDGTAAPMCAIAPTQYTSAVMFPFLQVNQERRQLQQNDYSRINCLY